jgi:hypothetical protein
LTSRLRVVIATTDGPRTIRRITLEDPALRSVVCLAGSATALPVSAAYDAFVRRPTGVVERDVGHGAFRLDVDGPIDEGRSWELGVYLAHRLKAVGRLAEDDMPADGVVWATGTVDADLAIGAVERVGDKARRSAALFGDGTPVLAIVAPEDADQLPRDSEVLPAARIEPVLAYLGLEDTARQRSSPPSGRRHGAVSLLLAVLLGGAAVLLWPSPPLEELPSTAVAPAAVPTQPALDPDATGYDPANVTLDVVEGRGEGDGCSAGAVVDPAVESAPGVCAVAFRVTNTGPVPVRMWLYAAVQGTFREYASRQRFTELADGFLQPGESGEVRVEPPRWVRRPVIVRGVLILAGSERPQVDQALIAIDLMPSGEIDALIDGLRVLGLDVRDVYHRVIPAP